MSTPVVVCTPYAYKAPKAAEFLQRCMEQVAGQKYDGLIRHLVMPNDLPPNPQRFGRHAAARAMLENFVPANWGIAWIDHDIVGLPADYIAEMVAISQFLDGAIVAPENRIDPCGNVYDGLFYDINAFETVDGEWARGSTGVPGDTIYQPMNSVGLGMYVPPSELRAFAYWHPEGDGLEPVAYCKRWREAGGQIYMTRKTTIYHANLYANGIPWH